MAQAVDCLYLLVASDDPLTARLAEDHGYRFTDIRLTFDTQVKTAPPAPLHTLRPARDDDLPELRVIALALLALHTSAAMGDIALVNYFSLNRGLRIWTYDDADSRETFFFAEREQG